MSGSVKILADIVARAGSYKGDVIYIRSRQIRKVPNYAGPALPILNDSGMYMALNVSVSVPSPRYSSAVITGCALMEVVKAEAVSNKSMFFISYFMFSGHKISIDC